MRKYLLCLLLAVAALTTTARAAEIPKDLERALPREAAELLPDEEFGDAAGFQSGLSAVWNNLSGRIGGILRARARGAAMVLLVALLCGVADGVQSAGEGSVALTPIVGALSVTTISAGSLQSLMGLGAETIDSMGVFSKALLPTLAAATASAGALGTATVQQVTTVFVIDLLIQLIRELLLPMAYLYIGVLTAGAMLSDRRLTALAGAVKKAVAWLLNAALIAFTLYLSIVRVVAGSADGAAVKVTKAAIAGAVPVVGGILSDAAETVLAGAGMLKNAIGVFGMLAVLSICALPFLHLAVQYLLYKVTAFLAGVMGPPGLCKLIDGLAGAFGLVLGMTGACALLLLVSILSSIAAVIP